MRHGRSLAAAVADRVAADQLLDAVDDRSPELSFAWEKLASILREPRLGELLAEHFEEIAADRSEIPLNPDWDHYRGLEEKGIFRLFVARAEGEFVGYAAWYVHVHPAVQALYAWAAPFYLAPEYRHGLNGYRLLTRSEPELQRLGVKRLIVHDKATSAYDPLWLRAGYRLYERSFSKLTGDSRCR